MLQMIFTTEGKKYEVDFLKFKLEKEEDSYSIFYGENLYAQYTYISTTEVDGKVTTTYRAALGENLEVWMPQIASGEIVYPGNEEDSITLWHDGMETFNDYVQQVFDTLITDITNYVHRVFILPQLNN
jgi:hypothetical protein